MVKIDINQTKKNDCLAKKKEKRIVLLLNQNVKDGHLLQILVQEAS